jgi:hypothetical protein
MGETIVPIVPEKSGNNRQISPSKQWLFTYNNYDEKGEEFLSSNIRRYCDIGFYSKEIGEETGTPHLQGWIKFKQKKRPSAIFGSQIWWTKAKGTMQENIDYCSKSSELCYKWGLPRSPNVLSLNAFSQEQRNVIDAVTHKEPNDREIVICYGDYNTGKTAIAKFLMYNHRAVILPTTKRHMLALASQYLDRDIFMFDLTAEESESPDTEFFDGLESLKNGIFASAFMKFTLPCLMASPHIIVFTNCPSQLWLTKMDPSRFINVKLPERYQI